MSNARERIEKMISENPVVLFMKGTPEFPQCGFSGQVIQILDYLGAPVVGVNVLEDADIRQEIKAYANWPTFPSSTSRVNSWAAATSPAKCSSRANWRPCLRTLAFE